ncbi:MAG: tRNA (adenosine(37)-N6)-dimethylallyltransferase MiaA [Bacteroidetes bacterium]|nr:MAG: tRNA (adenosine(37)-N6)-dimethylallyltransferase MiaA [Bacteroidota bacterium]
MQPNKKYLIVIGGATAIGKTGVAIHLARELNAPVLSADSRQFYREMSIGTAKPTPEEQAAAQHYFIDFLSVVDPYSVGDFERDALQKLEEIYQQSDCAILAGGSGLFLRAVYEGLDQFPAISDETRELVRQGAHTGGINWLQSELADRDPDYIEQVDRQNPARLRRALEVCIESGQPYSSFLGKKRPARPFTPIFILIERPRPELYARIDKRVDLMIREGLEEEARKLLPFRNEPALRTVGYEEWFAFFDGLIDRETAIAKIKQHSRNYAKRQATWFRKHGDWATFHPDETGAILAFIRKQLGRETSG